MKGEAENWVLTEHDGQTVAVHGYVSTSSPEKWILNGSFKTDLPGHLARVAFPATVEPAADFNSAVALAAEKSVAKYRSWREGLDGR